MADKAIAELVAASQITATDMFVLEQNGTAKKLTGQILLNWLTAAADGHGGIQSWVPLKTVGLVTTYRITLADQTYIDIDVVNGRGIKSMAPTSINGLEITYTITYNDDTTDTFTVTNGEKGEKGDDIYPWIKYASQKPTEASHSFGDVPDSWIGLYFGTLSTAPTDWKQYTWYQWKGEKGDTGDPATLISATVTYQVGDTGTIIPSGAWTESIPVVAQGKYLWTKIVQQFNTGSPITSYTVSRMGLDGLGSVVSVAGVSPVESGNVPLTAVDIRALPISGGDMEGGINMNGQTLSGLNAPTANDHAANMAYVNQQAKNAAPWNLLDNSDFTHPVYQRGNATTTGSGYGIDRWASSSGSGVVDIKSGYVNIRSTSGNGAYISQYLEPGKIRDGKTYTFVCEFLDGSVRFKSGEASPSMSGIAMWFDAHAIRLGYDSSKQNYYVMFSTTSTTGINVVNIALYEGEYTADTLPKYHPKGYAAELLECARYYYRITADRKSVV